jgi:hypothetical protein
MQLQLLPLKINANNQPIRTLPSHTPHHTISHTVKKHPWKTSPHRDVARAEGPLHPYAAAVAAANTNANFRPILNLSGHLVTTSCYSSGQKFGQTMDVSQGCKQAEHQVAFWSTWLHAVMPVPHSHGCRLRVSLRAGTWQSLQNCQFTAKNRPVFASICSTQQ